ncbi:hypothetical protein [Persicobacter psychrovividus]|uniref:Uncharacterized protein n=1 Tax=Persicobacter psychrovividus TaxID=387638 RepID=A0ABM7VBP8_9BACT|nr:hypothetical protein PEPS_06380 [Persicobacter psychrovividus]
MNKPLVNATFFAGGFRPMMLALGLFAAASLQSCKKKPAQSEPVAQEVSQVSNKTQELVEQAQYLYDNMNKMSVDHVKSEVSRIRSEAAGNAQVEAILKKVEEKLSVKEQLNHAQLLIDNFENYDLAYLKEETEKLHNSPYSEVKAQANQLDSMITAREKRASDARPTKVRLNEYMRNIGSASSPAKADQEIEKALSLFSNPNVDVLIIIGVFDGEKDFDKPTTIGQYLEYLKLQKKAPYSIENIETDASGKIRLLELQK